MKQANLWMLGFLAGTALLSACGTITSPTEYTLNLTGSGGVAVCVVEQERENETICESEGVYIPGQPSKPRTGIMLPYTAKATTTSWRSKYFNVEPVTTSTVEATVLRNGQVCLTTTLSGLGKRFTVRC